MSKPTTQAFTPTTDEVRTGWDVFAFRFGNNKDGDKEFDRWLDGHERQVAAKALREAALDVHPLAPADGQVSRSGVAEWLRERAESIEKGANR